MIYGGANNLPSSYHKRHAFLSYFSGAAAINIEGGNGLVDDTGKMPTQLGKFMEDFGVFVKKHQFKKCQRKEARGKSCTTEKMRGLNLGSSLNAIAPIVILVPLDHGYLTKPYWQTQVGNWKNRTITF